MSQTQVLDVSNVVLQPSRAEKTLKVNKNEWCNDSPPLAVIPTQSFTAECLFYSYFQKFSAFTDMSKPQVPKVASQCILDKANSMNNFFKDYRDMEDLYRNARATCYPWYTETFTSMAMLSADLKSMSL